MSLASGTKIGSYEVIEQIGVGGMGEVYRAHDTRLNRDVALKVLPVSVASDPDRLARFEREAHVLAALNHPNIATIHGVEERGSICALVMECVEGDDLSQRLARGPIPLPEALSIAKQIADALEAAHGKGIVHRDVKPANIKVRSDGTVKVLDFGLAKLAGSSESGSQDVLDASQAPTMRRPPMTAAGMIVGTAAYMSPEQIKGLPTDNRTDVWAWGAVLFEMLTGRAPFEGDTISDRLANILKTVPDWQGLPSDTPPSLRRVLRRALEKNENLRLRDIADARLEIDEARHEHMSPAREAATPRRAKERIAWLVAVVAVVAIAASALWPRRASPAAPEMQFDINTPPVPDAEDPASFALSSDGQKLVFLGTVDGQPQLMLRTLDSVAARPLAGTQGAYAPFWSADGGSVGFFADSALKRIDIQGGLVRTLARASFGTGGAWNREGVILYSPNPGSSLVRISAGGAAPVEATRLEPGHGGHLFPHFLPDGRHFLFSITGSPETRGIYSGELDQVTTRKLVEADGGAVYASGHLLFVRRTTLYAQAFDVSRLELSGTPMVVIQGVGSLSFFSAMSATADGSIAIRPGLVPKVNQLVWIDRTGAELGTIGDPEDRSSPAPSPDGNQIAIARRGPAGLGSIWLMDTRRGTLSPFTTNARQDLFPAWSRDGNRIAFASFGADGVSLYQKTIGSGREDLLLPGQPTETFPLDWSPDSRVLLYQQRGMNTGWDLWSLPVGSGGKPSPAIQSEADERDALFSPDGKWIAYVANTSGRFEVYVQAFPPQGTPKQVSRNGGAQIRWRADGRELFYIALDGRLMAVPLRVANQTLDVDMAVPLFSAKVGRALSAGPGASYIVSADGQRFLLNTVVQPPIPPPIRLMLNWRPPR